MLSTSDVQKLVETALPGASVAVQDLTGTSDHFAIQVVSDAFEGKSLIDRHRMVQQSLGEHLTTTIHAVDIKAKTPAEVG